MSTNPNTPTPQAAALAGYLQAQNVKAGAWRDRVYLNSVPPSCKAYLRADGYTPAAPLQGAELVVWCEDFTEKAGVVGALEDILRPLGYGGSVAPPVAPQAAPVAAPPAVPVAQPQTAFGGDSDIPFAPNVA